MAKQTSKNIRVGIFVLIGTIFIITGLYIIGDKQQLFGRTFRVTADFYNVNGLTPGNNVRYGGINVGTVESVEIYNDTSIRVVMVIKDKIKPFIKKNALATIGTDGLMGNKLVNIIAVSEAAPVIEDGDILSVRNQIETDEIVRTLSRTNTDVSVIAKNLREITEKINSPNGLWEILTDPTVAENVRETVVNIKLTSSQSATITGDLSKIIKDVQQGKGTLGALITDTTMSHTIKQTIVKIKVVSDTLGYITGDLRSVSKKMKNGEGALGTILMDTTFVHNLNKSMENIRKGSDNFNQNMEALKHSILLRKYFKKESENE